MTPEGFERGFRRLVAMWPDRSPAPETVAVYAEVLRGLDDAVWEQAVGLCLAECTFFPVPAELIRRAERVLSACGVLPPSGEAAWGDVLAVARYWSDVGSIRHGFRHDLEHQAIDRIGGMLRLALSDDYERRAMRADFLAVYEVERQRLIWGERLLERGLPAAEALKGAADALPALPG